jgi:hypothetical protein
MRVGVDMLTAWFIRLEDVVLLIVLGQGRLVADEAELRRAIIFLGQEKPFYLCAAARSCQQCQ